MRLSVVIPTRDRASFLAHALESLAAQELAPEFEVIVVDNGSTDETPRVVEESAPHLPFQVRRLYVAQPNRAKARNAGIAAARGEIVAFVDDDVWLPRKFMAAHAAAHEIGTNRAVSGPILNVPSYDDQPKPTLLNFSNAFFVTCNVSVEKTELDRVGGFDEVFDLYGWEDTELGLRLRESGVGRGFSWDAYLYHIKPPESETLDVLIGKTLEKATMAARFVRKSDSARVRAATGAYPLNLARAKAEGSFLALYAGLATSRRLPKAVTEMARARLLDGLYVERLRRELNAHPTG